MTKSDRVRVHHILDAAKEAIEFLKDKSRKDLDADRKLSLALVRLLEVIGEAARGISPEFREKHSKIPWKQMMGMRNRLIHGYYDINLDIIWETVTKDLPPLVSQLEKILKKK